MKIKPGDVIVRGRADIVELVVRKSPRWHLRALYLGKRFSVDLECDCVDDAQLATEADHAQAKAYADRFNKADHPDQGATTDGDE